MAVYRRGEIWWYEFQIGGTRYRGSTKERKKSAAQQFEAIAISRAREEGLPVFMRSAPVLSDWAKEFLDYCTSQVEAGHLDSDTERYYRGGWRLLKDTRLAGMRIDRIQTQHAAVLTFPAGPSNANMAFRTLRRLLNAAVSRKLLRSAPPIKCVEETGRTLLIEPWMEHMLLKHALEPLASIVKIMADTGMRPEEVMRMRRSDILWERSAIIVTKSKTSKRAGKPRFVPLSNRVHQILLPHKGLEDEFIFPGRRAKSGHRMSVAKQWAACVKAANARAKKNGTRELPRNLVLYCGRHTFATDLLAESKNIKLVKDTLGHTDVKTTMKYLHPEVASTTEFVNARNRRREMKVVGNE